MATKAEKKPIGKDLAAFRAAHDKSFIIPKRIRDALEALGDSWEYEGEFIRRCGVSPLDFSTYRDQFQDFYVDTSTQRDRAKRVWAGSKVFAAKMRAALNG